MVKPIWVPASIGDDGSFSTIVFAFTEPRAGRDRFVTLTGLWPIRQPAITYRAFREALAEVSDRALTPYDLRRTFAHWMEEAGVARTRRRLYMGHDARDLLDSYELVDVQTFLEADAQELRDFLSRSHGFSHSRKAKRPQSVAR